MVTHLPPAASYPPNLAWDAPLNLGPLTTLLDDATARYPTRTAVAFMGVTLTYTQVTTRVEALAHTLTSLGLGKGDTIALCLPNCPTAVVAYYAILRIGAVVVNTNPLYTATELGDILHDSAAKAIITTNLKVSLPKLLPHVGHGALQHLVLVDFTTELPWHLGLLFRLFKRSQLATVPHHSNIHRYNPSASSTPSTNTQSHTSSIKDLAVLQYTGGTTGTPKAAMLTHGALMANVRQIQLWLGDTPPEGDRTLAILPLFHCFAMTAGMNLTFANGGTLHLLPQFNLAHVLKTLDKQRITLLPGVPTLFNAILNASKLNPAGFSHLRYGISGGAPLPPEVKDKFEALTNSRLMEGYGLTEASPVVCCNPRHKRGKNSSAGLPIPGTHVGIFNPETLQPLPLSEVGEVWVSGPQLMQGYLNNPTATQACMMQHKGLTWLRSGDLGFLDDEGYLHLTDRLKDIILVNGYNVYPRVIEDCLYTHPNVAEAMVIGLPDPQRGETPHAYVVLKTDAKATEDDLMLFCRKHLNPLERPVQVVLRQSLPKTQVGKLSKKDLKAEVLGQ
ncbi:MAG: long-chain fatty acid--CoA ligase [Alphaproteobacteria bacterium]